MQDHITSAAAGAGKAALIPQSSEILTPQGAVAFLGGIITEATLQRWRSEGGGPKHCKIGMRRVGYRIACLLYTSPSPRD